MTRHWRHTPCGAWQLWCKPGSRFFMLAPHFVPASFFIRAIFLRALLCILVLFHTKIKIVKSYVLNVLFQSQCQKTTTTTEQKREVFLNNFWGASSKSVGSISCETALRWAVLKRQSKHSVCDGFHSSADSIKLTSRRREQRMTKRDVEADCCGRFEE